MQHIIISFSVVLILGCGETAFHSSNSAGISVNSSDNSSDQVRNSDPTKPSSENPSPETIGEDSSIQTETFESKLETIEIMFSLDSSKSMIIYKKNVANNLKTFFDLITKFADVKMGVISDNDFYGLKSSLSPQILQSITFYQRVVTSREPFKFFVEVLSKEGNNFYGPSSKQVLIVVTDHDVTKNFDIYMEAASLLSFEKFYPYGFIGIQGKEENGGAGCDIESRGATYETIAKKQGTFMFDVCDTDWSEESQKIIDHILINSSAPYELETAPKENVSFKVGKSQISPEHYKIEGTKVFLSKEVVKEAGEKIIITYRK